MMQVNCKHLDNGTCTHPKAPLGRRPHPSKCLRFCEVYDGPERPQFVKIAVGSVGEQASCIPCAKGAARRKEKSKVDPAEAARIMNDAINNPGKESPDGKEEVKTQPSIEQEPG